MANKEWIHETTTVYYPYEVGCSSETYNAVICPVCNEHYPLIEAMFFTHKKGLKHCPNCGEPLDKFFTDDRANGRIAGVHKSYIEVPCNIGDKIYRLNANKRVICPEQTVVAIHVAEKFNIRNRKMESHVLARNKGYNDGSVKVRFSEFGKTAFFSYEEAEEAADKYAKGEYEE